jgi:mannosyl-3-phosphoglycerate phosphatase family protein
MAASPPFTGLEAVPGPTKVRPMETRKRTAVRIRPKSTAARSDKAHRIAVFTAVDGTLLDSRTFEAGVSRTTIERLLAAGIPVIPMSVMTLEEIAPIAAGLGLRTAMVIEAGGAIARWRGGGWEVEPCGPPAETFLSVVQDIEDRSGASLLIYSAMEESAAAAVSGRSGPMLQASTRRAFSEPFVIESGNLEAIERAAAEIGFSLRRGRRFFHLCRECDEGEAFSRLREELQCDVAIAIGGSLVDAEFLARAEIPIVVPGPDGTVDPGLLEKVPEARIAPSAAPAGWSAAVEEAVRMTASRRRTRRVAS